ncbi:FAD-dependent oxidoreductase [Wenzhouxiangella sp. AB-CW3]|uniref:FAD-dependent oxidoreductase n=1 Tax=Wenzhouxiangella sp. AB-CW3 TaxID=2771012 RepID=UPI00168AF77D|nr:FAD-dependent oxidoreductase [Wenzhouxiangella sp. AB-CW3]QOC21968.1 FAD-dependent oxidoreductase [Wenzhouxiangella sp. AB-CW3]
MTSVSREFDVLVVGAGPAGLAAARAASRHGKRVGLMDARADAGGQVWRTDVKQGMPPPARRMMAALTRHGVTWLGQSEILMGQPDELLAETAKGTVRVPCRRLVLATGARELLLPFPGWTLPGVMGAGGAQALAKQGWPVRDRSVVVSGSGPLLLATAATLRRHGARVLAIHEQTAPRNLWRFAAHLPRWPQRLLQAMALRTRLAGVSYRAGSVVTCAHGDQRLQAVTVEDHHGRRQRIDCDLLATGYGLVPNVELAAMLGCQLTREAGQPCVLVDDGQHTSIGHVLAAGEVCGIGGRDCALIEGAIAGHMAAGHAAPAQALARQRRRARAFAGLLHDCFRLDERVAALAGDHTLVCRCEDVPLHALRDCTDARDARLAARCGMGACQGRICGAALRVLRPFPGYARPLARPRPPLVPATIDSLTSLSTHSRGADR